MSSKGKSPTWYPPQLSPTPGELSAALDYGRTFCEAIRNYDATLGGKPAAVIEDGDALNHLYRLVECVIRYDYLQTTIFRNGREGFFNRSSIGWDALDADLFALHEFEDDWFELCEAIQCICRCFMEFLTNDVDLLESSDEIPSWQVCWWLRPKGKRRNQKLLGFTYLRENEPRIGWSDEGSFFSGEIVGLSNGDSPPLSKLSGHVAHVVFDAEKFVWPMASEWILNDSMLSYYEPEIHGSDQGIPLVSAIEHPVSTLGGWIDFLTRRFPIDQSGNRMLGIHLSDLPDSDEPRYPRHYFDTDPFEHSLDIEARTRTRVMNHDVLNFRQIYEQFLEQKRQESLDISFADFCSQRFPKGEIVAVDRLPSLGNFKAEAVRDAAPEQEFDATGPAREYGGKRCRVVVTFIADDIDNAKLYINGHERIVTFNLAAWFYSMIRRFPAPAGPKAIEEDNPGCEGIRPNLLYKRLTGNLAPLVELLEPTRRGYKLTGSAWE